ncbi:TonB-dependent receptor [soil metagenome]
MRSYLIKTARRPFRYALLGGTCLTFSVSVALPEGLPQQPVIEPAAAEDTSAGEIVLDEVTVKSDEATAGGWESAPNTIYEMPKSVSVISRQTLDKNAPRNTSDIFRGTPGVYTSVNRQDPGLRINIRGLQDQGRVNANIDGARQNFQRAGHGSTSYTYIDSDLIGGVTIERGATSGEGGAGVIGGVVTFHTLEASDILKPGEIFGSRTIVTTGNNGYGFKGSTAIGAKLGDRINIAAAISVKHLGEYDVGKKGNIKIGSISGGWTEPSNPDELSKLTKQEQVSGLIKTNIQITSDQRLTLGWVGFQSDFAKSSASYVDTNTATNNTLSSHYEWTPNDPLFDVDAKLWFTHTKVDEDRPARESYGAFANIYTIDTYGGSLANTSQFKLPAFDIALTYGGEIFRDKTDTVTQKFTVTDDPQNAWFAGSSPNGKRDVASGFAEATFRYGGLELGAGLRYDHYSLSGKGQVKSQDVEGEKCEDLSWLDPALGIVCSPVLGDEFWQDFAIGRSEGRLLPRASIAITPVEGLQLYATYAQGFRPPTIAETLIGGEHVGGIGVLFAPNPFLDPETSETFEIGANVKYDDVLLPGDTLRAKLSLYHTTVDNFIVQGVSYLQLNGEPPAVLPYNTNVNILDPTHLRGVDFEAFYDAQTAYIGGSVSLIDADYGNEVSPLGLGADPDSLPPDAPAGALFEIVVPPEVKIALDGGVRLFDQRLTLGGRVTHMSRTEPQGNPSAALGLRLEDYTLFDLYASYAVTQNLLLRVNVDNLTDLAYVDALGSPLTAAPGRTASVSLQATF